MKKLPVTVIFIFLLLTVHEALAFSGEVHILLNESTPKGMLSGNSMTAQARDKSVSLASGSYNVTINRGKLRVGARDLTMPVTISASQPITWNGTRYYGQLTFISASNGFAVGNRLNIELYLSGVLRGEMNPAWHVEALKAQAILARTYTARNKGAHGAYDLCVSTHCQVYKGATTDDASISAAVVATRGLILRYAGSPAAVYYHADSGGMVTRSGAVWTTDLPYLRPRVEPVAYTSPNTTWEAALPMSQIQSALAGAGIKVGSVVSLAPVKRDQSGRVEQIKIEGTQGAEVISGHRFRTIMGGTVIKSTLFEFGSRSPYNLTTEVSAAPGAPAVTAATAPKADISQMPQNKEQQIEWMAENRVITTQEFMEILSVPDRRDRYIEIGIARIKGEKQIPATGSALGGRAPGSQPAATGNVRANLSMTPGIGGSVTFYGRGYGHGVGLSQWGAKAMAEQGWSYDKILSHYFHGTSLAQ